ncbi:hypothetical protein Tco_1481661, partial [Tanacetum coccineum]
CLYDSALEEDDDLTSYADSAVSRLRRNSVDICSPNRFDELLPPVLVVVSDLLFFAGRDLPVLGGHGLASSPNSSAWPTPGTCSPPVRSTCSTREGASHFTKDFKISHASCRINEILEFLCLAFVVDIVVVVEIIEVARESEGN